MRDVHLCFGREVTADRSGRRSGRVGRSHHRSPRRDRLGALDDRGHQRPTGNEVDEVSEERLVLMLAVVLLGDSSRVRI